MQLNGGEGVPQHQLEPFRHEPLPCIRLLGVIAEVGTLKQPPNDLTQGEDARDGAILEPAHEEALHIRLAAAHHPLGKGLCVGGRGYPAAMQCTAGGVPRDDLGLVTAGRFAQVDALAHLEGFSQVRFRHVAPIVAEPR